MKIFNSLTKQKELFKPVTPGVVTLYVCGMTVYDYCHIGHARSMIVFDMVTCYLRWRGWRVIYVHNITDIDDKIIARARDNQESVDQLTSRFIEAMHEDERALGLSKPDHEPRATHYIEQIIALINELMQNDYAYLTEQGDVCFDVRKYKAYGKLSHRDIDDLIAGARVGVATDKRDPLDFVLWKSAKPNEPSWDSPWGKGRPGWHIECSAMATSLLGQPFDIHGGGMDLKFPHHENEIAQSEAGKEQPFANLWMHVGLLTINDEKMSKSLNNFFTIRDVLEKYSAEVVRYFMFSGHYRSPVNYSQQALANAQQALTTLYTTLRDCPPGEACEYGSYQQQFLDAMDDDFNTPAALAVLFAMSHEVNRLRLAAELSAASALAKGLCELAGILGLLQSPPQHFLQGALDAATVQQIETLITLRNEARRDKNWAEADKLRDQLTALGISLEDKPEGTLWRKET